MLSQCSKTCVHAIATFQAIIAKHMYSMNIYSDLRGYYALCLRKLSVCGSIMPL